jgi:hypothetical protein
LVKLQSSYLAVGKREHPHPKFLFRDPASAISICCAATISSIAILTCSGCPRRRRESGKKTDDEFDDMLADFRAADLANAPASHVAPMPENGIRPLHMLREKKAHK